MTRKELDDKEQDVLNRLRSVHVPQIEVFKYLNIHERVFRTGDGGDLQIVWLSNLVHSKTRIEFSRYARHRQAPTSLILEIEGGGNGETKILTRS